MTALSIIIDIVLILISIVLIVTVLMQEGQRQGLGAIGGGAETFFGKNKAKSMEGKLQKYTKIAATAFIVLAIVATIVTSHNTSSPAPVGIDDAIVEEAADAVEETADEAAAAVEDTADEAAAAVEETAEEAAGAAEKAADAVTDTAEEAADAVTEAADNAAAEVEAAADAAEEPAAEATAAN